MIFDELVWGDGQLTLRGWVFELESRREVNVDVGRESFSFYKTKRLMDQYRAFWSTRPDLRPKHILELGVWDGGSLAIWYEQFEPEKLVGVDLAGRQDSEYFKRYLAQRDRASRIKTYWGVDQANRERLREIVAAEFADQLDLVLDDASHRYAPTKTSFETLFPLLRTGGLYIIEDWSWAFWPNLQADAHRPLGSELPRFIVQLMEATGTMAPYLTEPGSMQSLAPLIANVVVYPDFVVVERGSAKVESGRALEDLITRSPQLEQVIKHPPAGKPWWRWW